VPSAIAAASQRERSWLIERDQFAAPVGAGGASRVGQQHQRQQAADLGLLGQRQPRDPGQPDRLGGELGTGQLGPLARRVALVEDQVEDAERGAQPLRPVLGGGQTGRLRGRCDRLLGAGDPPPHRRLGDEEGGEPSKDRPCTRSRNPSPRLLSPKRRCRLLRLPRSWPRFAASAR